MSMVFLKVFIFFPFSYTEPARRSCPDSRVISSIAFTSFSVVSRIFGTPNMPETMAAPAAWLPAHAAGRAVIPCFSVWTSAYDNGLKLPLALAHCLCKSAPLRTDTGTVGCILNVVAGVHLPIPAKQGCRYMKMGIRCIGAPKTVQGCLYQ